MNISSSGFSLTNFKLLIFIVIVILAGYFGYKYFSNNQKSTIITIDPDEGETKIKPVDTGGIVVPNTENTIYDSLKSGQKETKTVNLLPEPEEPVNIKSTNAGIEESEDPLDAIFSKITNEDNVGITETSERNVVTTTMNDKDLPTNTTSKYSNLNITYVNESTSKQIKNNENQKHIGYRLQLVSVKTQHEAVQEWERLKRKHSKILGNSVVSYRKVNREHGKFFYLVLAGNYQTIHQARAACKKLSFRQQNCIIAK